MKELMSNFKKDTLAKACHGSSTKIEAFVEINSGFFEWNAR
jgi:hypothetical protein